MRQYRRVDVTTLQGLKTAERLKESGWRVVSSTWWTILFEKGGTK